jgi:hypothetical protein
MLSPEGLRQRVMEDFLGDYSAEEAQDDAVVLGLLGLLDPEVDLWNLYLELFTEQVAGFYDDEDERMYMVAGSAFGGLERMTYAHEFVHALQDQTYDLDQGLGYNDQACEEDSEGCAAVQSLIEGDATLLSEQWLRTYATSQDFREILEFYQVYESPVFETAPRFLQQDFLFPYDSGLAFVRGLFLQGGWAAVDAAYRDPPRSTEHILHPERYPDDAPVLLDLGDTARLESALGQGWRQIDRDVLGEWTIRLMLEEHLPAGEAYTAAEGWGGDLYLAYQQPETGQAVLVWIASWDTLRDAYEFAQAFRAYSETRFGDTYALDQGFAAQGTPGYMLFERNSKQTLWLIAPHQEVAQALRETVPFPAPQQ